MTTVSIVIPTHNCIEYLLEALGSVFAQTFQDFDVIVVDDGSTDNTEESLSRFAGRVQYLKQKQSGPGAARNRGILEGHGKYIAFLDSDDLWAPNKLERQVAYMESHPNIVMVFTDFSRNEHPGVKVENHLLRYNHVSSGDIFLALLKENFVATPSVMIRRDVFAITGLFEPNLFGAEDFDLWLRIAHAGNVGHIEEVLTFVREHENQTTRTVKFWRDSVRAKQLSLARWSSNPEAVGLIRSKLGKTYFALGYSERKAGRYRAAALAFRESYRHGEQRVSSLLRAVAFGVLPPKLIDIVKPPESRDP